jgi:aminoglycoside/choline kinase family phosphotransferase
MRPDTTDPRARALNGWLQQRHPGFAPPQPLGADASFRRYFRTRRGDTPFVVMDAPPTHEDIRPFLRIASVLHELGLRAPRILDTDPEQGFILMEDLGDQTFTRALAAGVPETDLYTLAARVLAALQSRWSEREATLAPAAALPLYDTGLLLREARLFIDWYWPKVHGADAEPETRADFEQAWGSVLEAIPELPTTLVLRDFHVDNLMLLRGGEGVAACGLLDFQDAVAGSPAYDLVSLLQDARRDVSAPIAERILDATLVEGSWPAAEFLHHYRVFGAQRTVKIIGIFTRLERRDHKPGYQVHQPRLWRLLDRGLRYPELAPVADWFRRHFHPDGQPCGR